MEREASDILPKTVKGRAMKLLKWLSARGKLSWRPGTHELVSGGIVHPGTNIIDLAGHAVHAKHAQPPKRGSPGPPPVFEVFAALLRQANAPRELVKTQRRWDMVYAPLAELEEVSDAEGNGSDANDGGAKAMGHEGGCIQNAAAYQTVTIFAVGVFTMSRRNLKPNKAGKTRRSQKEEDVRIRKRYRQPGMPGSLASAQSLRKALSPKTLAIVARALEDEESYKLHRPVRYRFPRRPTVVAGPGQQLQCDLVDCSAYKQNNKGTRYLFCCIDVFSKYAWARPLQTKRGVETAWAMEEILAELNEPPLAVQSDKGPEMRVRPFQRVLSERGIRFFTSENDDIKASIIQRFQKTLQTKIHRHMTANRSHAFVDVLPALLRNYNATYHSAIGMAPRAVTDAIAEQVWLRLYGPDQKKMSRKMTSIDSKLKRGDHVRLSKTRRQFAKGYTGHWSRENFLVTDILNTVPVTYRIMDVRGEDVSGTFYGLELQKITPPDYFDVEAVLDTRRKHGRMEYLVKWANYPASFNSWETDLITPVA